jgi:RimJ/RimL family protein N-acetyltransferase
MQFTLFIKEVNKMLVGKNIELKLIEKEDIQLIVKWRNESYEAFYEYPFSNIGQEIWFEEHVNSNNFLFIIYERSSNNRIGMVGLSNLDNRNKNVEFGRFIIDKEFRGKGYGKEVLILVLNYVFKHLNFHSVYLDTFKNNIRVINLYKKIGFKQEGIKRDHIYKNGKYNDIICMRILKKEYRI